MKACEVTGWFDAGHVGELEEAIRRDANAETPLFGFAGFEIGESFVADEIDDGVGGVAVFVRADAR